MRKHAAAALCKVQPSSAKLNIYVISFGRKVEADELVRRHASTVVCEAQLAKSIISLLHPQEGYHLKVVTCHDDVIHLLLTTFFVNL